MREGGWRRRRGGGHGGGEGLEDAVVDARARVIGRWEGRYESTCGGHGRQHGRGTNTVRGFAAAGGGVCSPQRGTRQGGRRGGGGGPRHRRVVGSPARRAYPQARPRQCFGGVFHWLIEIGRHCVGVKNNDTLEPSAERGMGDGAGEVDRDVGGGGLSRPPRVPARAHPRGCPPICAGVEVVWLSTQAFRARDSGAGSICEPPCRGWGVGKVVRDVGQPPLSNLRVRMRPPQTPSCVRAFVLNVSAQFFFVFGGCCGAAR